MRRRSILEGFEEKPELQLNGLRRDLEQLKYEGLILRAVNTNAAASYFRAIQHQVIGACPDLAQITILPQDGPVLRPRRSKGMMDGVPPFGLFVPFKRRECLPP